MWFTDHLIACRCHAWLAQAMSTPSSGSRVTRHVLLAQRTSSIGGAAPERSLVRDGIQTPGLDHYSVTARTARIRRASQPGEHEAIVGACIVAIAERPFQMLPDLRD